MDSFVFMCIYNRVSLPSVRPLPSTREQPWASPSRKEAVAIASSALIVFYFRPDRHFRGGMLSTGVPGGLVGYLRAY